MWTGVFPVLAQLAVIVAGSILLLWPDNDKATGKDAYTKETDMMILEMLYCDECNRPLTLGKEHRCPPKRFCLEGGCGTPFYSNDPARTLCIVHMAFLPTGTPGGFATGLLGVPAVQEALDIINAEATKRFIKAYEAMLTRQDSI